MDLTDFINQQLDRIMAILEQELVPDQVNAIYDHRTLPSKLPFVISVSYLGGSPGSGTAGSFDLHSDFALVLETHHEKSTETLRWAERQMNKVEALIINAFQQAFFVQDGCWISTEFYKPSTRPPSPSNYPDARLGHLYLRVHF
jgi:hypothetical protein